jgi:3-methylcrotonyl-CoA carboxylase alpha subunit
VEAALVKISWEGAARDVCLEKDAALLDGRRVAFAESAGEGGERQIWLDGRRHAVAVAVEGSRVLVFCEGRTFAFERGEARRARSAEHDGDLVAPMPGRVRRALVAEGERVERGQVLLVLEAMKMEHAIRSPRDGVVTRLAHGEGDLVEAGTELALIEGSPTS